MGARVIGIGTSLPEKVLTNDDLAAMVDTSDEWIWERTGVRERHIGLPTSTMSIEAGRAAMDMAGVGPEDIDLLIVATTTPTSGSPAPRPWSTPNSASTAAAFDLNAACAGFTYGFVTASSMMDAAGGPERVLLIGADSLSPITDWTDRGTAILFSDGGGAVVLERTDYPTLLGWDLGADGHQRRLLMSDHDSHITMEGREVFKVAVRAVSDSVRVALDRAGLSADDVDVVLPHQANIRDHRGHLQAHRARFRQDPQCDRITPETTAPRRSHSRWPRPTPTARSSPMPSC